MSKKTRILAFIIIGFIIIAQLALFTYIFHMIDKVKIIDADVYVTKKRVGFNFDPDKLHFGEVPVGKVSSKRYVNVTNDADYGLDVILAGRGALGKWVGFELPDGTATNSFYLKPKGKMNLKIFAAPPEGTPLGKYEGKIIIIFKKHRFFN